MNQSRVLVLEKLPSIAEDPRRGRFCPCCCEMSTFFCGHTIWDVPKFVDDSNFPVHCLLTAFGLQWVSVLLRGRHDLRVWIKNIFISGPTSKRRVLFFKSDTKYIFLQRYTKKYAEVQWTKSQKLLQNLQRASLHWMNELFWMETHSATDRRTPLHVFIRTLQLSSQLGMPKKWFFVPCRDCQEICGSEEEEQQQHYEKQNVFASVENRVVNFYSAASWCTPSW